MEITTVLLILRIAACLAGGFWLARQLRGMIPAIVLRLMPSKHRFSENAFRIQTRISTVVAVVVTLGGAALINEGIEWVASQVRTQTRTSIRPEPRPHTPMGIAPPPTEYEYPQPETRNYPNQLPAETKDYPDPPRRAEAPPQSAGTWCYQLYALDNESNAREQQAALSRKLPRPVQLSYLQGDTGPYKLYIAGFADRSEALRFGKKHGLTGFPRPAHQLQ